MRNPRVFTQHRAAVAAGADLALDVSLFRNDGEGAVAIQSMGILVGGAGFTQIRAAVKPTSGPVWSEKPVPLALLPNLVGTQVGSANSWAWRLRHPYWLDSVGNMGVHLKNAHASGSANVAVAFIGHQDDTVRTLARERWSPRVLWAQIDTLATATGAVFDIQDLTNWGDRPMTVHRIAVRAYDPDGNDAAGTRTVGNQGQDAIRVKIRCAGVPWTVQDRFISMGAIRHGMSQAIEFGDIEVPADAAFHVAVFNNSGGTVSPIHVGVIGSVRV